MYDKNNVFAIAAGKLFLTFVKRGMCENVTKLLPNK